MSRFLPILLFLIGLFGLLGAILLNPNFLEEYLLIDHRIENRVFFLVLYGMALLLFVLGIHILKKAAHLWRFPNSPTTIHLRRLVTGFGLSILSSGMILSICELSLRKFAQPERVLGGEDLWRYHWARSYPSFKKDHPGEYIRTNKKISSDVYSPILGWVPRPHYRSSRLNTNSRGLRSRKEYPYEKKSSEYRITTIGDSFTFGEDVRDEETYPFLLEKLLKDTSVVNLGVPGYGTDQAYLYLKREGLKYSPNLVMWGILVAEGDTNRNILSFRDYAKPRFSVRGDRLILQNSPVPPPEVLWRSLNPFPMPKCYLWSFSRKVVMDRMIFGNLESWKITTRILDKAVEDLQRSRSKLLLFTIPSDVGKRPEMGEFILDRWAKRRNVPMVHLRKEFLKLDLNEREGLYDEHWTSFGNRVVAEILQKKLIEEKRISPP